MVTKARALLGYEDTKIGAYLDHSHIAKIDLGTTGPYLLIKQAIDRAILENSEQQVSLGHFYKPRSGDAPLRRTASATPLLGDNEEYKTMLIPQLARSLGHCRILNETEGIKRLVTATGSGPLLCHPSPINKDLPINSAIYDSDTAKVRRSLEDGHLDKPDSQGYTPLMVAAANNQGQLVHDLIRRGASLKISGPKGDTAFHLACRHAGVAVVSIFLKHAELLDIRGAEGRTPLMSSIRNPREDIAKLVLGSVDNVEASDEHEMTALHYAALEGKTEIVRLLIKIHRASQNATTKEYGWTPLHYAAQRKHPDVVELLGKNGTDCNTLTSKQDGARSAIHLLLLEPELLRYKAGCMSTLLRYGANIDLADGAGRNPLHWAAQHGKSGTVEWLISKKANLEARTEDEHRSTALHVAVQGGHLETSKVLLDAGSDKNAAPESHPGKRALHIATEQNSIDLVKELLARKADVDIEGGECGRRTPLAIATCNENTAIMRLLLESGASVEGVDNRSNYGPLTIAARIGNLPVFRTLLNYDANPRLLGKALFTATEIGSIPVMKELLAKGMKADVECTDYKGFRCLFIATSKGHVDAVELLLDHGADPERKVEVIAHYPDWSSQKDEYRAGEYFEPEVSEESRRRICAMLPQVQRGREDLY